MFAIMRSRPKVKRFKTVKKAVYGDPQDFNVQCIEVDLTMKDGTNFTVTIYGEFFQYTNPSYNSLIDDQVGTPGVTTALQRAQSLIQYMVGENTYVNDIKNPARSVTGQVVKAAIDPGSVRDFTEQHIVASLADKEIELP